MLTVTIKASRKLCSLQLMRNIVVEDADSGQPEAVKTSLPDQVGCQGVLPSKQASIPQQNLNGRQSQHVRTPDPEQMEQQQLQVPVGQTEADAQMKRRICIWFENLGLLEYFSAWSHEVSGPVTAREMQQHFERAKVYECVLLIDCTVLLLRDRSAFPCRATAVGGFELHCIRRFKRFCQ